MKFCSSTTLRNARQSLATISDPTGMFARGNLAQYEEENSALSARWCTLSQVDENDIKNTRITLRTTSAFTVFARFGSRRLLRVHIPQKNTNRKEFFNRITKEMLEQRRNKLFYWLLYKLFSRSVNCRWDIKSSTIKHLKVALNL